MNFCPSALLQLVVDRLSGRIPTPTCCLVLGGDRRRELLAAQRCDAKVLLLSSGCASEAELREALSPARAALTSVIVDRAATDTVTNFTTIVDKLRASGVRSVAVATAVPHMQRAGTIGTIVLGAQGIHTVPWPVDAGERLHESWLRTMRDGLRALLWVLCGLHLGGLVGRIVHPSRFADTSAWLAERRRAAAGEDPLLVELRAALNVKERGS